MLLNPCQKLVQAVYRPRRPEKSILFEVVKKHYRTWKRNAQNPVSRHVEKAFEKYLECGNPANGFACAHCGCCHTDFFIAFSCKKRGICPSCNTRTMVATAAHLIEHVIPLVPMRQWVISFPLRIRHYLLEHVIRQDVLEIVVEEIKKKVLACSPNIPNAHIGAVSFIQNFGSTLNVHPHFHLIVADGLFYVEGEELQFHETALTQDDIRATQKSIQEHVLRYFGKRGWFSNDEIEKMLTYENSGFSLDASVRIHSWDREGLERLIRYCARPCFAGENLRWNGRRLVYHLSKPTHKGQTSIQLDPLEFLDKISALIPLPHRHLRHYHGVFAPNSPLRKRVVACAKRRLDQTISPSIRNVVERAKRVSLDWARLIARIYEVDPLICSRCGNRIKILGFVTHKSEIYRILRGIGWPIKSHDFDSPYDLPCDDTCQLVPNTEDGFPAMEVQVQFDILPDSHSQENYSDPPDWESYSDPPHHENDVDPPHWND
jgi:hypothetical protein